MRQTKQQINEVSERLDRAKSEAGYFDAMMTDLFRRPFTELSPEEQKEAWQKGEIPTVLR